MAGAFGFYGKIPALGDFMRGGTISRAFVTAWDPFLQAGFLASRAALGDDWAETYQTAPIWRFSLGAGVIDGGPYTGVMMPSQDAVGRVFPLTLVVASAPPRGGLDTRDYYLPIEDAALNMLDSLRGKIDLENAILNLETPDITTETPDNLSEWLSAPDEGYGQPLGLSHAGLPSETSFQTLLTQDVSTWSGSVTKGQ
ncbi:MAG: type VI secretion system-associated protein TagF [Rhodobacteraceae bacterium]|nr:type VI secretion system-associated protein TagF [Paracoccaceae bacterium]